MDESAGELPCEVGSYFHVQPKERRPEGVVTELKAIVAHAEAMNIIPMVEAAYGLQLVEQLHQQKGEEELSEEATFTNTKTALDPDEVEKATLIDLVTTPLQSVEEEHGQQNETDTTVPCAEFSDKIIEVSAETISEHDGVEKTAQIDLVTTPLQLGEQVHQQENETEASVSCAEVGKKIIQLCAETISEHDQVENITSAGQETCLGKDSRTEVTIPSMEGTEKLTDAEMKPVSKDDEAQNSILTDSATDGLQMGEEPLQDNETGFVDDSVVVNMKPILNNHETEDSILTGQATIDPRLAEGLIQQENDTKPGCLGKSSAPVAETEPQVGNVNTSEVVMVEEEKEVEELEFLNAVMNQKLKRIEEIAEQVRSIDTEIAQMEFQCSEAKCRHAKFIELFRFIAESQLPLRAHREIQQLIRRKDKAAQELLFHAMDLQVSINAQAKLKLTLQEESTELAKLVDAHKLRIHQILKETEQVINLEEAVDSGMASPCNKIKLTYTRKRKSRHGGQLLKEETSSSEMQVKRMALNTAGDSVQEFAQHSMVTNP